jgi:hypothetical protein
MLNSWFAPDDHQSALPDCSHALLSWSVIPWVQSPRSSFGQRQVEHLVVHDSLAMVAAPVERHVEREGQAAHARGPIHLAPAFRSIRGPSRIGVVGL